MQQSKSNKNGFLSGLKFFDVFGETVKLTY